jgi:hypothetical protein
MMIADTVVENEKAIGFFNRLGFTAEGKHVWLAKTLRREDSKEEKPEPGDLRRSRRRGARTEPHVAQGAAVELPAREDPFNGQA